MTTIVGEEEACGVTGGRAKGGMSLDASRNFGDWGPVDLGGFWANVAGAGLANGAVGCVPAYR